MAVTAARHRPRPGPRLHPPRLRGRGGLSVLRPQTQHPGRQRCRAPALDRLAPCPRPRRRSRLHARQRRGVPRVRLADAHAPGGGRVPRGVHRRAAGRGARPRAALTARCQAAHPAGQRRRSRLLVSAHRLFAAWLALGWVIISWLRLLGMDMASSRLVAYVLGLGLLAIAVEAFWRRSRLAALYFVAGVGALGVRREGTVLAGGRCRGAAAHPAAGAGRGGPRASPAGCRARRYARTGGRGAGARLARARHHRRGLAAGARVGPRRRCARVRRHAVDAPAARRGERARHRAHRGRHLACGGVADRPEDGFG